MSCMAIVMKIHMVAHQNTCAYGCLIMCDFALSINAQSHFVLLIFSVDGFSFFQFAIH
jgi:hypothetical protein